LLVDYIFALTPEEQRRVSAAMGKKAAAGGAPSPLRVSNGDGSGQK